MYQNQSAQIEKSLRTCLSSIDRAWLPGTLPWITKHDPALIKSMRDIANRIDTASLIKPMQGIRKINALLAVYFSQHMEAIERYKEYRRDMRVQIRNILG